MIDNLIWILNFFFVKDTSFPWEIKHIKLIVFLALTLLTYILQKSLSSKKNT